MAAPSPPPPSGAWFAGVVKTVSSGDQLVIEGKGKVRRALRAPVHASEPPPSCRVTPTPLCHRQGDAAGPERLITLAAIMAPRAVRSAAARAARVAARRCHSRCDAADAADVTQGRRDDPHAKDEPYAWQSREFLRQKCIGQARPLQLRCSAARR
jgi:hypothetical protein